MSSPLLKPRWLTGHALVVGLTVAFVFLGFWQLSRHFDQRDDNAFLEERLAANPVDLEDLAGTAAQLEFRQAIITGRYDYGAQLELRPKVRSGVAGYEQIIPLETSEGVVLVNRGFIAESAGSARLVLQLESEITVTGTIRASQGTSRFGPQNPDTGALDSIARVDIERLNTQFTGALVPAYLDLISEQPPAGGLPSVPPLVPATTTRPNLPYAIQWWAFAAVVSVGWVIYLRKELY